MSAWKLLNLINLPLSILQNAFNASMQARQNKHNEKLVDMQNKAAETQAEKAYIRSLPSNQMQNMRSAGISDFAAAQAISGGGTYQPAPVNTSQGQAPQIDLNGAMQAVLSSAQLKEQKRQFDLDQQEKKRQFNAQLEFEKGKWKEEAPMREANLTSVKFQNEINKALSEYKDEHGNKHNLLVEGAAAERLANMTEHRLNALKYDLITSAVELPANILKQLIRDINDAVQNSQSFIEDIRSGKKTTDEVYDYSRYDHLPNQITHDGKKFKRIKLSDGVYEWREVK